MSAPSLHIESTDFGMALPKIEGVTLLSSRRLLVKRLCRKPPRYCLVNRQEIVLFS